MEKFKQTISSIDRHTDFVFGKSKGLFPYFVFDCPYFTLEFDSEECSSSAPWQCDVRTFIISSLDHILEPSSISGLSIQFVALPGDDGKPQFTADVDPKVLGIDGLYPLHTLHEYIDVCLSLYYLFHLYFLSK